MAENAMGRAECATKLTVRGEFPMTMMVKYAASIAKDLNTKGLLSFSPPRINEDTENTAVVLRSLGKKKV